MKHILHRYVRNINRA